VWIIAVNCINRSFCVMGVRCVYCEVRTDLLAGWSTLCALCVTVLQHYIVSGIDEFQLRNGRCIEVTGFFRHTCDTLQCTAVNCDGVPVL
jgi:hypothetical protein